MRAWGVLSGTLLLATCAVPSFALDVYGPYNPLTVDPYTNKPPVYDYPKPEQVRAPTVAADSKIAQGLGRTAKLVHDDFSIIAGAERANAKTAQYTKAVAGIVAGGVAAGGGKWGGILAKASKPLRVAGKGMNWLGYATTAYSLWSLVSEINGSDDEIRSGDVRYPVPSTGGGQTGSTKPGTIVATKPFPGDHPYDEAIQLLPSLNTAVAYQSGTATYVYVHALIREDVPLTYHFETGDRTIDVVQGGAARYYEPKSEVVIDGVKYRDSLVGIFIRGIHAFTGFSIETPTFTAPPPTTPPDPSQPTPGALKPDQLPPDAAGLPLRPEAFDSIIRKALEEAGITANDATIARYSKEAARDIEGTELTKPVDAELGKSLVNNPGGSPLYSYVPQAVSNTAPGSPNAVSETPPTASSPSKVDQEIEVEDDDKNGGFGLPTIHVDGFTAGAEQCPTWDIPFAKKTYRLDPGCRYFDQYSTVLRAIAMVGAIMLGLTGFRRG